MVEPQRYFVPPPPPPSIAMSSVSVILVVFCWITRIMRIPTRKWGLREDDQTRLFSISTMTKGKYLKFSKLCILISFFANFDKYLMDFCWRAMINHSIMLFDKGVRSSKKCIRKKNKKSDFQIRCKEFSYVLCIQWSKNPTHRYLRYQRLNLKAELWHILIEFEGI